MERSRRLVLNLFASFVLVFGVAGASATQINVAPDGSGDVPDLVTAVAVAGASDVIVLADGVYTGPGNRDIELPARDCHIRSLAGDPSTCVIDLQGHRGFVQLNQNRLWLEGVTLTNGYRAEGGGAICTDRAELTAQRCRFLGNSAGEYGAAIYTRRHSQPVVIEDCEFAGNSGGTSVSGASFYGQALNMRRCVFHDHDGALSAVLEESGVGSTIADCVFRDNHVGGSSLKLSGWSAAVTGCLFLSNDAVYYGAVMLSLTRATFTGCTFLDNAGMLVSDINPYHVDEDSDLVIDRCLFAHGRSRYAVIGHPAKLPVITCTNIYSAGEGWHPTIAAQLRQSGNLDVDPMICDLAGGDLRLADISPCLPANNTCHELIGRYGQGCVSEGYLVRPDGSGGLPNIQTALDIAPAGATVLLADGVFTGPGNADLDFHGKALTLRSLSGNAGACVIEAGDAERVMRFHAGEGATTIVRDLTLRGGSRAFEGGVVLVEAAAPWFLDCRFEAGLAYLGGGLAVTSNGWPVLRDCVFLGSTADVGGAVWVSGAHADLFTCTIAANHAPVAACYVQDGVLRLEQSIIAHNTGGPAVLPFTNGTAYLAACDLFGNEGGDWTAPILAQRDLRDNFLAPPCFCDLDAGSVSLCADSWCLPEHNPLGNGLRVGALGLGCEGCGCGGPVETQDDGSATVPPLVGMALAAQPNPFNPATTLAYRLDVAGPAELAVFDLRGRRVATLLQGSLPAGEGHVVWNGRDDAGRALEAGAYLCRLESAASVRTITIALVK